MLTPDAGRGWRAFRPNLSATLVLHESTGLEFTLSVQEGEDCRRNPGLGAPVFSLTAA